MSKLVLVPTPIGNLGDMTFRAVEVLRDADLILAEDTRNSGKLLKHFEIRTPMKSYHAHNEHSRMDQWISDLKAGKKIALISDAGTPGISDPGFLIVRACLDEGIEVECLPGATAFVPALVQSGLPIHNFIFEGFLPQKKGRKTRLENLSGESRTLVLYESPHRLVRLLKELGEYFGAERQVCVCRELSKLHEENVRGSVAEVLNTFDQKTVKGELVIIIDGHKS